MKRKRFSTEQIVAAMKQHELGTPAAEIIRKLGIAEQTFYRWKRRYAGSSQGDGGNEPQVKAGVQ
jgi:putative transposase